MYVLVLLLNLSCKFEMNGTIKDGILMVAVTLQIRKKKSELLLNSKYYFDFLSSNIKFRTAETQTAFLDASPETISFSLVYIFTSFIWFTTPFGTAWTRFS